MSPVRASLSYGVTGADVTPPATVSDFFLVASNGTDDVLIATNALPGDNGMAGGRPAHYEIRRAASVIDTEGKWASAAPSPGDGNGFGLNDCAGIPGQYVEFYLLNLTPGTHWYHIRFTDLAGNVGGISNGVQVVLA